MGADLAYLGTRFIASRESLAPEDFKTMVCGARASDIVYTPAISGISGNYLRPSIVAAGLDPERLEASERAELEYKVKAWRDVWSAGQGVGAINDVPTTAELCRRLAEEYRAAMRRAAADPFAR
jgi:nitronate monooxygenase